MMAKLTQLFSFRADKQFNLSNDTTQTVNGNNFFFSKKKTAFLS